MTGVQTLVNFAERGTKIRPFQIWEQSMRGVQIFAHPKSGKEA